VITPLGKWLVVMGLVMVLAGLALWGLGSLGFGRLPGDIYVRRGNMTFYFPLATCILLSVLISLLLMLFRR
jgi:multisubunit Na+/H+ antiporter MnhG subunit